MKNKKIYIINKGELEKFPPTITLSKSLRKEDVEVKIICTSCYDGLVKELAKKSIEVIQIGNTVDRYGKFGTLKTWYNFRMGVWSIINNISDSNFKLWVATADTAICLGKKLLEKEYYLTILELYDTIPIYKNMLKKYAIGAKKVITPEVCRANIFKVWWGLKERPIVIPNKPDMSELDIESLEVSLEPNIYDLIFNSDKKFILYQGLINRERDLTTIAKALNKINDDNYIFLVIGTDYDGTVKQLKGLYKNLIHVDYIPNPHYFKITQRAYMGITTYDDSSLNHIFCAPNKIFEYTYFGIPILGRDIPGLEYTVGIAKAGVCVDTNDIESIVNGILKIEGNYKLYKENAYKYFDSVDIDKEVKKIVK